MATSPFSTTQLLSTQFVESAGAIIFHLPTRRICLIHNLPLDEWLLPKGRRNCTESRHQAALREAREETGYSCRILPVRMETRAPPAIETEEGGSPDIVRMEERGTEPFMLTMREIGTQGVKVIWWYVAAVEEAQVVGKGEAKFQPALFGYDEAVERLAFQLDREIVQKAILLVEDTNQGV